MESDACSESICEVAQKSTNKTRLSLFLPPDVTTSEPTKITDEEYVKKLKSEEETWIQLYNEQKEIKKKLLKKLEVNEPHCIDYSLFDEEEIKYLNAGPNVTKFVQEAENLQNTVKIVSLQCEAKRRKYSLMIENIENACGYMISTLNS